MDEVRVYFYVCGPTVYDDVHIGNLRPILTFDLVLRAMRFLNPNESIRLIHNITDIDDKIINRAKSENKKPVAISQLYETRYHELLKDINVFPIDHMPRVTDEIDGIKAFIADLINLGHAYVVENNVFFRVSKFATYGCVSNQKLEALNYDEAFQTYHKEHMADFVLWKSTNDDSVYDSPWGQGRPGWHTECAFFVTKFTGGESLVAHGGGIDLIFPHHENEDAQFYARFGKHIAKQWFHTGLVNFDGSKMSKSTGRIIKASDFNALHGNDTLRMLFLNSSLRAPLELTSELIVQTKQKLHKFTKAFKKASLVLTTLPSQSDLSLEIFQALANWNFAKANKQINFLISAFFKNESQQNAIDLIKTFEVLGFNFAREGLSVQERNLYQTWLMLREQKLYREADILREELVELGLI